MGVLYISLHYAAYVFFFLMATHVAIDFFKRFDLKSALKIALEYMVVLVLAFACVGFMDMDLTPQEKAWADNFSKTMFKEGK
ncbi:hypothetical protein [Laceyella putida]|uniref:DUF3307 domain-containing protein n=1 Tax=Laceyella putida TaxID=110101 RepID=A0ABW2RR71_9BACL